VGGGPRLRHAPSAGPLVSLALSLRGITREDPRAWAAFEALLRVLDGGMSGRVYQRLCVRDGLAYSVDAEVIDHGDATLLQFTSDVAPPRLAQVVGDTLDVLAALARRPVSADELGRVREGYRLALLDQLDDGAAMAEWFGAALLYRQPERPSVRLQRMRQVTASDVRLAARQVARPDRLALAVVGPLGRTHLSALRKAVRQRLQGTARPGGRAVPPLRTRSR
jgi:predicted Zn-dependent peptidase